MQQKIKKVKQYLPANKQIFQQYAQFEEVLELPEKIKSQFFDSNIQMIAQQFTKQCYAEAKLQDIEQDQMITQFMDWLESGKMRFKRTLKSQAKPIVKQQNQEKRTNHQANKLNSMQKVKIPILTLPEKKINLPVSTGMNQPGSQNPVSKVYQPAVQQPASLTSPHQRPVRPLINNLNYQQQQTHSDPKKQLTDPNYQRQRVQHQPLLDNQKANLYAILSRCLQYPQKRFHFMPEMMNANTRGQYSNTNNFHNKRF